MTQHPLRIWQEKIRRENTQTGSSEGTAGDKRPPSTVGWKQRNVFVHQVMIVFTLITVVFYQILALAGAFQSPEVQLVEDFRLNTDYRDASIPFTSLALGQNGKLLLGSDGRGLQVYDTDSGALGSWEQFTHENTHGGLLSNQVFSLAASDQRFWVAAGGGLSSANFNLGHWNTAIDTSVFKYLDIQRNINTVRLTPDATTLFVGTNSDGVGIYDTRQHRWMALNAEGENLFSDTINTLELGLGSVWVGTDKGLNVFKLESFFSQASPIRQNNLELENLDVRQIIVQDQDVWVRTAAGGVRILKTDRQNKSSSWRVLISDNGFPAAGQASTEITAVAQIDKRLFVGTRENGIGVYDTESHDWNVYSESNGLWSNDIRVMTVLSQTLWVATADGINSFDAGTSVWRKVDAAAGEDIVNLKANADNIWYVTARGEVGVYHVSEESWESIIGSGKYGTADSSTSIRSLAVYQDLIWVASSDQGVGSYDPQKHSWQLRNDGLPSTNGLLDQEVVELQVINGGLWSRAASGTVAAPIFTVYQWQGTQWTQASRDGQNVRAMVGDGASVWFLLTDGSLVDQKTGRRYFDSTIDHSIQFNAAVSVGGNELYLSSSENGIWHYDLRNHNWQRLPLVTGSRIHDVATNGESIWYATRNGGVGNYQLSSSKDQWVFPEALAEIDSSSLAIKTVDVFQGSFWFADENGRVYEYNPVSHIVQEHSDGLDFIQSTKDIQNLQIRAGNQSLWYFVTTRSEQQDSGALYQYDTSKKNWLMVSNATQNVAELEVQGDQAWYRTVAGAVVNVSETGKQQSYFSGTFKGLEDIVDIKIDDFGRLWFVSGSHGAAYYIPTAHSWRSVSVPDTLTAITIIPGQSKGVQEAYITATTGLYHATLTRNKISDWKPELTGYEILNLIADGNTLYALAQQDGKGIWLFNKTETDWVPMIQDPWIGTNVSLHSELVYQDKLWGIGSDGSLWVYDPEQHDLKRAAEGSSKFISLAVMDDRLWAFSSYSDDPYKTDVYRISGDDTEYRLSYRYTASVPPQKLVIFADRLWQTNDQGLATILTENGVSQPIIGGQPPAFRQTAVREVFLRVPKEWVWYLAIVILIVVEVLAGVSWWNTKESRLVLMISTAILLVSLSVVYSYFYGLVLDQNNSHRQMAATSLASSIVSFDDKVWIGSDQGVWQFRYNSLSHQVIEEQYDPLGSVEELRVVENVLYVHLQNGNVKKYDHGWQDVDEIPPLQASFISEHWKVLRGDEKVDVQLRESEKTYRSVEFENGGFKHDQIRNAVIQGGDLWMATAGGVVRYRPKEDGSGLTLIRIYGIPDGLTEEAVQDCTVAADHVVCMLDGQKLVRFEDGRWQPYSGDNPFDAMHTIYQFPSQDLALQANTKGEITVPANLADANHERFAFDHVQDLTVDAQGDFWVGTPSEAWRWSALDSTKAPTWEFSRLTADVKQGFEAGRARGNRQTWPIDDSGWQWKRSVDAVTGREQLQIVFSKDPGIIRQFTPTSKFADQFVHAVWAEKPIEGETTLWLGTQSGIWKAVYSPGVKDISILKLKSYYPVNRARIEAFREENGKLYAQTALADQAFIYDPVKDDWSYSSLNPFLRSQVVLAVPNLGPLAQETAEGVQINPTVETQGRFPFDIIQGIASQSGFLWVATKDGVLQYKHNGTDLELVQRYSTADGLLSANVTGIKTDQQGSLFSSIENGQAYFRLSQDKKWYKVAPDLSPFQAPKIRIEKVPGLATWYFEGNHISAEFQGEPVTFQNGVFDFDNVRDVFLEKDLMWSLTGHGILQYHTPSPIEFQGYTPTWSMASPPEKLIRRDNQTFVRVGSGSYYSWQQPAWQDQGTCQDRACPFEYASLQLQDAQWKTVSSPDGPLPRSRIRISGIPTDQIFDPGGKFSFDFVESIAVTPSSAWLATRGGVVQFETQPEFLFRQLSALDDNLPTLNVARICLADDQVMVSFVNDARIFRYDFTHDPNWKETSLKTDPFTVQGVVFENGNWQYVLFPEKEGAPLIQIPGAPPGFQLFDISGKFSFDYVEKIQWVDPILQIQTRGGLLQARYQDDRLVIQKISFNAPESFKSALPQIQFRLSHNPVDLVLRSAPGTGVQLWRDHTLMASYSNTEKYLGLFGSRVPVDSIVDVAQDDQRIYLATQSKLIIINKPIIERDLGPWVPNTPTPTLTSTSLPSPVATASSPATLTTATTPGPSATALLPRPINTAVSKAVVLESSNVRSGPGMEYPVMISYVEGTELPVTGISQNGDWLRVILMDGREGWIHRRLVRLSIDISLLPKVAESPATPTK